MTSITAMRRLPSVRSLSRSWRTLSAFVAVLLLPWPLQAARLTLRAVEATTETRPDQLAKAVDGVEAGVGGWAVPGQTDRTHSVVFACTEMQPAGSLRLWLSFLSGNPDSAFRRFSLSITRDASPSLGGRWEVVAPTWYNSTDGEIVRENGQLRVTGTLQTPVYLLETPLLPPGVTGLRLDVYPSPDVAGAALLTELRAERKEVRTTNIALGCTVISSNPLAYGQRPEHLTDGLTGTMAHPPSPDLGDTFYFQLDLRRVARLDHISLRNRADGKATERLSKVLIQLYDRPPGPGVPPVWTALHRADGSYPEPGQTDVVRAAAGKGDFCGRYLRLSSTSTVAFSPQLAEVEVYESLVPPDTEVTAGNQKLPPGDAYHIPASAPWLSFVIKSPLLPGNIPLGRRWRIAGVSSEWMPVPNSGVVESRALPPGKYLFQALLRHTDLEWNDAMLSVPLIVPLPFWQRPLVRVLAVLLSVALASLVAWRIARRRMAVKVAELEQRQQLGRERARIARDMHDVVGSRLTQLMVMHEIFAAEHPLPGDAGQKLDQLGATARAAISELDEAVWAVNPSNDTLSSLANYLCHTATEYLTPLGITCRQEVPDEWPDIPVTSHHRHELLLAFKEALQNVVKHSHATLVTVTLGIDPQHFLVQLEDNGCGLPDKLDGMEKDGLKNMTSRLTAIGGNCHVQSRLDGGTMVKMQAPLHHP